MDSLPVEDVTVLHVDDDRSILDLAADVIELERPAITVESTTDPEEVLERIEAEPPVDCVVSDYQMVDWNGLDLLAEIRKRDADVPFVLFTGKGSEEIASEAISAGVTDYIQKESGTDQYAVLANRIEHAVAQQRAQVEVEHTKARYQQLISHSSDVIAVADPDGTATYVSSAADRVLGYDPETLEGMNLVEYVHPDDQAAVAATFEDLLESPDQKPTVEVRFRHGDGSWIRIEAEGRNLLDDEVVGGIVVYARDVSERAKRQADLERYEQIVEIAGDGAYVLDADGKYEMVNQKTIDRTGYAEDELIGTDGAIVFDEEDVQTARQHMLEVYQSDDRDFAQFEATVQAKDGTEYPVEIRAAPIVEDGEIVGSVGTSRDIADRKQRERELERYERIVEAAGDAAQVLDEEGRYVMVNDALVERTGYDREELIGNTPEMVMSEADYRETAENLRAVIGSPDRDYAEFRVTIQTADGDEYPVEGRTAPIFEDGEFQGSVGISRDISDRKRRQRELERYETIVEAAGDAANVLDTEGRYVMVNDAFVDRTGYDREDLIGERATKVISEEDFERSVELLEEVMSSPDRDFAEQELTVETATGGRYPAEVRMAPLVEDGEFQGVVGIIREITERKRREHELERQNERLGNFATVVSHDLRNPLNVAQARIELSREDPDGGHLDVASDAIGRMEGLIDDLLTLAREGRTVEESQPIDLESVATEAWASVATADATLDIQTDQTVDGDRSRVRQVFENLFRNAVEHGSTNPRSPSAHEDAVEQGAQTTGADEGQKLTVTVGTLPAGGFYVEDDGRGLQGADQDAIFEANVSTKDEGTGLGLAIARDIVEAHGWRISADPGAEGLRFEIETSPRTDDVTTD